jgi:hypothetical protein
MGLGKALEVPIFWLWAEKVAEDLIAAGHGMQSPATFEYRATRDVLALTLFLAEVDRTWADLPVGCLERIRDHMAIAPRWLNWCRSGLAAAEVVAGASDMCLARAAWLWLGRGRLLAGPGFAGLACGHEAGLTAGAACCVGLNRARRIVDERLAERS